ncbi:MAG: hypothetical protein J7M05_00155, partial [Anaerolineae bacterium]|nr:hypothetical protein [Anaerolineae bacterium]
WCFGLGGRAQKVESLYEFDVTGALQRWLADPAANYGLLLRGVGGASRQLSLASSEYPQETLRPILAITYTRPISSVTPPEGDGLLVGTVLGEGSGNAPSSTCAIPLTITLSRVGDGLPVYHRQVQLGEEGTFTLEGLCPGRYDLLLRAPHALPLLRREVEITSGLNVVRLGPLVEGDVVPDGYITARDWLALTQVFGAQEGEEEYNPQADLNDDGRIDILDVAILSENYGRFGPIVQEGNPSPPPNPQLPKAVLWVNPSQRHLQVGQQATFTVMLETKGHSVNGVDLTISFDPQLLSLVQARPTGCLPTLLPGSDLSGQDGQLRYVAISAKHPLSGTAPLLQLTFQAIAQGEAQLTFAPEAHPHVASGSYDVLGETRGAQVSIDQRMRLFFPQVEGSKPKREGFDLPGSLEEEGVSLPVVGSYPLESEAWEARDVRLQGGYAYMVVATFYEAPEYLYVFDVRQPFAPQLIERWGGGGREPDEIWLEGGRAFIARKGGGVDVLDISSPPTVQGLGCFFWNAPHRPIAKGLHAVGDLLYVADEWYGLQVVDVSDPSQPRLLGSYGQGTVFGEGVWVDGSVAYVCAGRPGIRLIEVSDPRHPYPLHSEALAVPGRSVDAQVEDGYLYVAAEDGGLSAYDVHDPQLPAYLGTLDTHFAQKVDVHDRLVYLADDEGGLLVVDASDPSAMKVVGHGDVPGRAFGVSVEGRYAYVAAGAAGLQVVDLAPLTPTCTPTATPSPTPTPLGLLIEVPLVFKAAR